MDRKNIGLNIRALRRQAGMTQAQMAEKTGVSTDHISHVEIGSGTISLPLLIELCNLLEVTPNDILAGEYRPNPIDEIDMFQEGSLSEKDFSSKKINPEDMMLLQYIYRYMTKRGKKA